METRFGGNDEITLVSSSSGKSESCLNVSDSSRQRALPVTVLMGIFGLVLVILMCLLVVVLILLVNQNSSISSLTEQVGDLHGRIGLIDEEISNLTRSIGHLYVKGTKPVQQAFRAKKPSATTPATTQDYQPECPFLNTLQRLNFTESSLATRGGLSGNNTGQEMLQELYSFMETFASEMISSFGLFRKGIEDVNTNSQEIKTILKESKESVRKAKKETQELCVKLTKAVSEVSTALTTSGTKLANVMTTNNGSVNVTDSVQEILSLVAGLDANVTQIKGSVDSIGGRLNLWHEKYLFKLPEPLVPFDNTTFKCTMTGGEKNKTLCMATDLQPIKSQGIEIIERIVNISTIQVPLLLHVQKKTISVLKKQFRILRNQFDFRKANGSNTQVSESFCDHKGKCMSFKAESLMHCYQVSETKLKWPEAQKKCRKMGGYLVEVSSASELRFLKHVVDYEAAYWMGATDVESEGHWVWQHSKQAMTLHTWNKGEPNNMNKEHCAMGFHGMTVWNDAPCTAILHYICERDDGECW